MDKVEIGLSTVATKNGKKVNCGRDADPMLAAHIYLRFL